MGCWESPYSIRVYPALRWWLVMVSEGTEVRKPTGFGASFGASGASDLCVTGTSGMPTTWCTD
uniref:Uncharacterized protein n=1 Tax=Rhizophora mucronata TaxID=61149 RepID=A0A2P2NNJ4_RHIMU